MFLNVLLEKMDGAPPEARFFLIKYLQAYGFENDVELTVRDIVDNFGINDRAVRRALSFLTEKRYLTQNKLLRHGRGRPRQTISVGPQLHELVEKWSVCGGEIIHGKLIARVLRVGRKKVVAWQVSDQSANWNKTEVIQFKKLNIAGRLLLSVLLASADRMGVIRGIGMAYLTSVTGLNRVQLRGHLKIFLGCGYLFRYIPGGVIKGVKGKLKSIFILPLDRFTGKAIGDFHLFTSNCLPWLEQILKLANSLKSSYRKPTRLKFFLACSRDREHWLSRHPIDKNSFTYIVRSSDFLASIDQKNERLLDILHMFLCDLAVSILIDKHINNMKGKKFEKYVIYKVIEECKYYKLSLSGSRRMTCNVLRLLAGMVRGLYDEARSGFTKEIIDGVMYPFSGDDDLRLCYVAGIS